MIGYKIQWQQLVTISILCGLTSLTISGCNRSNHHKNEQQEVKAKTENTQVKTQNNSQAQISCDDPAIKQSILNVINDNIQQQSKTLMTEYIKRANLEIDNQQIIEKLAELKIDINNQTTLQTTDKGTISCQASLNITIPSQDLFNASEIYAAINANNLQDRLAEHNIHLNNNTMIDDKFSYIIGKQSGDLGVRLANQPTIFTMVSDVITNSTLKMAKEQRKKQQLEQARKSTASKPQVKSLPKPEKINIQPLQVQPLPNIPTLVDLSDKPFLTENHTDKTSKTTSATDIVPTAPNTQTQKIPTQLETSELNSTKPEPKIDSNKLENQHNKPKSEQVITETTTKTPKQETNKPKASIKIREVTEPSKQEEIVQLEKMDNIQKTNNSSKNDKKPVYQGNLKPPADDSMDMVIIEENRTY